MKLKSLQAVEPLSGSGLIIGLDLERGFGGCHSRQVQLVSNPVNARVVTRESSFGVGQVPAQCHRQKGAGVGVEVLGDSTCAGHAESHNRQDRSHQDTSNSAPVAQRGGGVIPGPAAPGAADTATGAAAGRDAPDTAKQQAVCQGSGVQQGVGARGQGKNSGRLGAITREMLEPLWLNSMLSTDAIGERLGVTGSAIRWQARKFGLPHRGHDAKKRSRDDAFSRLWNAGVSTRSMADQLGYMRAASVSNRARDMGLPRRHREKGAGRKNGRGANGWVGTITYEQHCQDEYARRMREEVSRG